MAEIVLRGNVAQTVTGVSNIFIDEYMSDANGEFVKIYLYLLRLCNSPDCSFSLSSIADKFDHTEKDIKRALAYWERMQLLSPEYDAADNLTGIRLLPPTGHRDSVAIPATAGQPSPAEQQAREVPAGPEEDAVPQPKVYSADDILNFREQSEVAELFFITERYLGRTLSATDINTILYLYDGLHLSAELVEYLVEYCVSKGHTGIRYIEKTGLAWAKNHIRTVSEAKQSGRVYGQTYFPILKAFGITGREPVAPEMEFIDKWRKEYGFSTELILEACKRTMAAIHRPSFEYTDSILNNWRKNDIHSLSDVIGADGLRQDKKRQSPPAQTGLPASKNRFNNFNQRTYDFEQLEKMILTAETGR